MFLWQTLRAQAQETLPIVSLGERRSERQRASWLGREGVSKRTRPGPVSQRYVILVYRVRTVLAHRPV